MFNCDIYYRVIVGFIMKNFITWDAILGAATLHFSVVTNTGFNICVVL